MIWDLVFCSFALHLVQSPSELFALLYELSGKAMWLVVIGPTKLPHVSDAVRPSAEQQIKEGWGWVRWDLGAWKAAGNKVYRLEGDDEPSTLEIKREQCVAA